MKAFSELVSEVLQDCQQAPEPLIQRAARNAVIEFCEQTLCIRRTLDPITIEADVPTYVLTPEANTLIIEVMSAQINDYDPLVPSSQDQLDLWWQTPSQSLINFTSWIDDDEDLTGGNSWRQFTQSIPECYYIDKNNADYRMRLVGIPTDTIADALNVVVALKPSRSATQIDDWFIEDHYLRLLDGARAKMLMMPGRPWTNPNLAAVYAEQFGSAIIEQKGKSLRDYVRDDETTGRVRSHY